MTDYNATLTATYRYPVPRQQVQFEGGPLDGIIETIYFVLEIDGRRGVVSFHGEGFYALADGEPVRPHSVLRAMWCPHPDACFWWTRYV